MRANHFTRQRDSQRNVILIDFLASLECARRTGLRGGRREREAGAPLMDGERRHGSVEDRAPCKGPFSTRHFINYFKINPEIIHGPPLPPSLDSYLFPLQSSKEKILGKSALFF